MKKCTKCNELKILGEFYKKTNSKDGHTPTCKKCNNINTKKYYKNNKNRILEDQKIKREINPKFYQKKSLDYYYKNSIVLNKKHKEYVKKNKEKRNKYWREYQNSRWKNDPLYKISKTLRKHIYLYLKNGDIIKNKKTFEMIGFSPQEYRRVIGEIKEGYHIDHKVPISWFKKDTPICLVWSLDNLQNIPNIENWSKRDYFNHPISKEYKNKIKQYIKNKFIKKLKYV